ncbi:MAG: hypothetical protein H7646_16895 [Candidatus Heimdallarchaeota archaeon]|nr:hypothetical protein [Candidatus Heimdallarchaeota archaeon]
MTKNKIKRYESKDGKYYLLVTEKTANLFEVTNRTKKAISSKPVLHLIRFSYMLKRLWKTEKTLKKGD